MNYDVIVAGGGIAGISAALSARRAGANRVLLLEQSFLLGGLATAGLITIYLPLCDGQGRQVSFGLAEELLLLSVRHGHEGRYPSAWLDQDSTKNRSEQRFEVQYNPWLFAIEAEQLLLREGVEVLYGATVAEVRTEGSRIVSAEIAFRGGKEEFSGNAFVDATGDANLFALAGAPTVNFGQGNPQAGWYYSTRDGENRLEMLGACDIPEEYRQPDAPKPAVRYEGLDAAELSRMVSDSHRLLKDHFLRQGENTPAHRLTAIASIPQVRMTRRIDGALVLDDKEPWKSECSSIGMIADWRKKGKAYELPYEILYCPTLTNAFAAGRCISVTDSMWDITRVIPVCAVTGQAAGIAARFSAETRADSASVQRELERQQVPLHF